MPTMKRSSVTTLLVVSACSALLGALLALAWLDPCDRRGLTAQELVPRPAIPAPIAGRPTPPRAAAPRPALAGPHDLTEEERVAVNVYESVNMSVVNISTKGIRGDAFFFLELQTEGTGSGTVIDARGHILTNFHVVEDAREVQVTLFNGQSFEGRLVGRDPISDVAVLKIDAPSDMLYPVAFGDSNRLRVGQNVYAIGNPFGLERTLTRGVVSSLNRSLPGRDHHTLKSIIQIDAAINPGNSGGPLLDSHGRLIGMNTAIASRTGQSAGVGFAIPVNTIARVVPQLIEKGRVIRADAGIAAVYQTEQGLRIAQLVPGGPAERAGLRGPKVVRRRRGPIVYETIDRAAADLIVGVDDEPAQTADEFLSAIESHHPGEVAKITVIRDGREESFRVTLGEAQE
jgi:S1-C subfamily serine protease